MFASFFYLLRARGLDISLGEWLTLTEALQKGLHGSRLIDFYDLCRAVLVKTEADYDKFDGAFLEFFRDLELSDALPDELLDWLNNPQDPRNEDPDMGKAEDNAWLSNEEIRRMFEERLEEQKEEHNGGSYWIGTTGVSTFGNDGHSPKGIRVGGSSSKRMAMQVAGERRFRDFREDETLDLRRYQIALRSLRQFSCRMDLPRTELNIDETVRQTGDNGGSLKIVFDKPRKNTVKLLLLIDSGGSMDAHSTLCTTLFQAVSKSNHFKDLKVYYFHNCIKSHLYTTPVIRPEERVETEWVLRNLDGDYKVIIVGDALMEPSELLEEGFNYITRERVPAGIAWLRRITARYPRLVWLNPSGQQMWQNSFWSAAADIIRREVEMLPLTVENLTAAIKMLMVAR